MIEFGVKLSKEFLSIFLYKIKKLCPTIDINNPKLVSLYLCLHYGLDISYNDSYFFIYDKDNNIKFFKNSLKLFSIDSNIAMIQEFH